MILTSPAHPRSVVRRTVLPLLAAILPALASAGSGASAQQAAPGAWPELPTTFESTGGGGWMITEYRPVVDGNVCRTDFVAVSPDGVRFANRVEWSAEPGDGGMHCRRGVWRAKDGSAQGTTPLEVFIADGVVRRAPERP